MLTSTGSEMGALLDLSLANGELVVCARRAPSSRQRLAVVFLHGLIGHQKTWLAVAPRLPPDLDWLSIDLAGRGASQNVEPIWGIDRHVDDVMEIASILGYDDLLVVGYSFGAFVGCRIAEQFPDMVSAVVAIDGGVTISTGVALSPEQALRVFLGDSWPRINKVYKTRHNYTDAWRSHPDFRKLPAAVLDEYISYGSGGVAPNVTNRLNLEAVTCDGFELLGDGPCVTSLARLSQPVELLRSEFAGNGSQARLITDSAVATFSDVKSEMDCRIIPDTQHPVMPLLPKGADAIAAAIKRQRRLL